MIFFAPLAALMVGAQPYNWADTGAINYNAVAGVQPFFGAGPAAVDNKQSGANQEAVRGPEGRPAISQAEFDRLYGKNKSIQTSKKRILPAILIAAQLGLSGGGIVGAIASESILKNACTNKGRPTASKEDDNKMELCPEGVAGIFNGFCYCYNMPDGSVCRSDAMCYSKHCRGSSGIYTSGICGKLAVDSSCSINADCTNNACGRNGQRDSNKICCSSGAVCAATNSLDYCKNSLGRGSVCWTDCQCKNGNCKGNTWGNGKCN